MLQRYSIVFFIALFAYPLGYTFYLSFHTWDMLSPPVWVGLDNYKYLLQSPDFQNSIVKTIYYVVGVCVPLLILSILFAAFFNQKVR
ncbi:MAG TPA: sugar ABC transporter permease, partial [Chloroflexota bacterium]|nr:sugar ABC transporter permease [Chloroflexota bacterium]